MPSLEIRLSQFGPAFAWLMSKGVSADRLASLFVTTAENIRVIVFRTRHAVAPETPEQTALDTSPTPELAARLGIRAEPDEVVQTRVRTRKLESLRDEIDKTVHRCAAEYAFSQGAKALRKLMAQIGYAGDARRIALRAQLHQHLAWFLVHSGRCISASEEAAAARDLWRHAYHEAGSPEYAASYVEAALVGSNALLLAREPQQAWAVLKLAKDAAEAIGAPLGSEHYRQRGVALFQLREDDRAVRMFERAPKAMEQLGEARNPAHLLMTGTRQINLLQGLKCDRARELIVTAQQSFGSESLEASMALHWAAACGFSTDSTSEIQQAVDSLGTASPPSAQFGHQATIRKLLAITPELELDSRLRSAWVRRALYENAFRAR